MVIIGRKSRGFVVSRRRIEMEADKGIGMHAFGKGWSRFEANVTVRVARHDYVRAPQPQFLRNAIGQLQRIGLFHVALAGAVFIFGTRVRTTMARVNYDRSFGKA